MASRLEPTQVGVGVSQVVPIVAAVFDEIDWNNVVEGQCRLLMIEQPELHLHPEAQAALGDLFIEVIRDNGRILLIETHSKCLI